MDLLLKTWSVKVEVAQLNNYLCIITFPRSGSDALKRIIGESDNVEMHNESTGFIISLCDVVIKAESVYSPMLYSKSGNLIHTSMMGLDDSNFKKMYTDLKNIFIDDFLNCKDLNKIIAWKENNISPIDYGEEKCFRYIETIKKMMPNIKIVFNTRNAIETSSSGLWKRKPNAIDEINRWNKFIINSYNKYPNNSILIDHSVWSNDYNYLVSELSKIDIDINNDKCKKIANFKLNHLKYW